MHARFSLTLVVNHACNLRCAYCYTGEKLRRAMPAHTGQKAIERAIASITPGGTLELGFFGGEPLIEADLILELVGFARQQTAARGLELELSMTTNGTLDSPAVWRVMTLPEMRLAVSHDGLPSVHDRHRIAVDGQPSSRRVEQTIARLLEAEQEFCVVMVVRPDNVGALAAGMEYLYARGVRQFTPSLDLWATWTRADGQRLQEAVRSAADFWAERLPTCSVSWFDEKAARLSGLTSSETARCDFDHTQIAVTPAGNLYPCERLIGADEANNPMRLPGDVVLGDDFLDYRPAAQKSATECTQCVLQSLCSTTCHCSNYVRTGDTTRPDALLCWWDQACHRETIRVLESQTLLNV